MKKIVLSTQVLLMAVFLSLSSCTAKKQVNRVAEKNGDSVEISEKEKEVFDSTEEKPVEISDEESNYQIIIIDPGFYNWLLSIARPEGYYSQQFLENRNQLYVIEWNWRVLQPQRFDPLLYEQQINYDPQIDYGYEVNYKLYNYFIYFQRKYGLRLGPWLPRI
ncbi:DUF6146 family protein [Allomuricauda sp. SCSIO 65647]|uniref:DUF6146 family protein n=1 Tax=Allomuricauda sp. SCSIO 65647 TaxID=2908843 RepID=UPI001F255B67|nr:DUF6146 family protein [Muricauda sp. SCSIO 65647]UJH67204.1 DUF6146 family protein [Muricauda sp. SCSIO 65647]